MSIRWRGRKLARGRTFHFNGFPSDALKTLDLFGNQPKKSRLLREVNNSIK